MLKNYITTTLRNIAGNKFYSVINILGLSVGITCAILILLYLDDDLS